jgi:hypothetical protein
MSTNSQLPRNLPEDLIKTPNFKAGKEKAMLGGKTAGDSEFVGENG